MRVCVCGKDAKTSNSNKGKNSFFFQRNNSLSYTQREVQQYHASKVFLDSDFHMGPTLFMSAARDFFC